MFRLIEQYFYNFKVCVGNFWKSLKRSFYSFEVKLVCKIQKASEKLLAKLSAKFYEKGIYLNTYVNGGK